MKKDLPTWLWALIAILCVICIGVIDSTGEFELNFFVFHFLPVSLAMNRRPIEAMEHLYETLSCERCPF